MFLVLNVMGFVVLGESLTDSEQEAKILLRRVSPSIVKVVAENAKKYIATGIVTEGKYVITSSLITNHPYQRISIETNGSEQFAATVAGTDSISGITLLKWSGKNLPSLPVSENADVGDWVLLVGNFYNRFPSLFQGLISAVSPDEMIIDASVAPGAAGGAVIDRKGALIGLIRGSFSYSLIPDYTFRSPSAEIVVAAGRTGKDLCYAVPSRRLLKVTSELKRHGRVRRSWLGVQVDGPTMTVEMVTAGSPAEKAGFAPGDRIMEADGVAMNDELDLMRFIQTLEPGRKVKIKYIRGNRTLWANTEIAERPPSSLEEWNSPWGVISLNAEHENIDMLPPLQEYYFNLAGLGRWQLGVDMIELTPPLAEKYEIKEKHGLLVSMIQPGTPADKAGLKVGDVFIRVAGHSLMSLNDFRTTLNQLKEKEPVLIELYREGRLRKFSIVPEPRRDFSREMEAFQRQLQFFETFRNQGKLEELIRSKGDSSLSDEERMNIESQNKQLLDTLQIYRIELKKMKEELEALKKKKEDRKKQ